MAENRASLGNSGKVAMIGDPVSLAGFSPLGVAVYPLELKAGKSRYQEALVVWDMVLSSGYAVVFVTEPVYELLESEIIEVLARPLPAVMVIPAVDSNKGLGGAKLDAAIEKALGTKMNFGQE